MKNIMDTVANEISHVLSLVNEEEAITLSQQLKQAKRVFVHGEGRSGLMGKAFAMRMMHGGYQVFVIGETITPSISKDDLLVVISGSGSTGAAFSFAQKGKETGAKLAVVTTNRESSLGKIADYILVIPAATKYRLPHEPKTIQPLGNQFDQSVHLLLDAIVIHSLGGGDDLNQELKERHANLE